MSKFMQETLVALGTVARTLDARRESMQLSRSELARRACVCRGTVARALDPATIGKVRIRQLGRIVQTLGVTIRFSAGAAGQRRFSE